MIAAVLLACSPSPEATSGARWDGPFGFAELVEAGPLPRPASLDAPVPERAGEVSWAAVPAVRARAAFDPVALDRVLSWVDDDPDRFGQALPPLDDAVCAHLASAVAEHPDLAWYLAGCRDPAHASVFEASDAEAAVRWAHELGDHGPPPELGLRRAAEAARLLGADDDVLVLLAQLCETDRPDLAGGLRAVLEAAPDPTERDALAAACPHQSDPVLGDAHERACAGACDLAPDVLRDPEEALAHAQVWGPGVLARHPAQRDALLAAAARCAGDVDRIHAAHCLATLALHDWSRARTVAAGRPPSAEPALAALQAALAAYGDPRELEARLEADGLLGAPTGVRVTGVPVGAFERLRGRGRSVDVAWPVEAVATAVRAADAWPGLGIEGLPAPDGWDGRAALRAWDGERRWHAWGAPGEEAADAAAFFNALMEERGSAWRAARPSERPNALVFGPGEALRALHESGLLPLVEQGP